MQKIIFSLLLLCIVFFGSHAQQPQPSLNIGDPAPSIQVRKWIKGVPIVKFEKGKVYVVEFWATWCLPCIGGMPHLSELAHKYRKKVTIAGISILERKNTTPSRIDAFVDSMGRKMDYNVAAEDSNYMATTWLKAAGERGIPFAFVIDQQGRIAWMGHPKNLDEVLPLVVNGSWDIAQARAQREEDRRLRELDYNEMTRRLNPFMGNPGKPDSALLEIAKILEAEPKLKYSARVGHYTFWSLIKTDPAKAAVFGREMMKAKSYTDPPYKSITDAVSAMSNSHKELPAEVYEVGAEAYQAQINNYPWSMDIPATYATIAEWYIKAGNKGKAVQAMTEAIRAAEKKQGFDSSKLADFRARLKTIQSS